MKLRSTAANKRNTTSLYRCYRTSEPINIDGILDEEIWMQAPPIPYFGDLTTGSPPAFSTNAKIIWDHDYLYVSYALQDPNIWAHNTVRDVPMCYQNIGLVSCLNEVVPEKSGWDGYEESFVKLYIDPDCDGMNYVEIHVNPLNNICDKWMETSWHADARVLCGIPADKEPNPHVEWNCPGLKTAVVIDGTLNDPYDADRGWIVEMAIPFDSLKHLAPSISCPPKAGDRWRIHLGRRFRASEDAEDVYYWTWPVLNEISCHYPSKWGEILFEDSSVHDSPRTDICSFHQSASLFIPKDTTYLENLPKVHFNWKAIWATTEPDIGTGEAETIIDQTQQMGFNTIILGINEGRDGSGLKDCIPGTGKRSSIEFFSNVAALAKSRGMQVYPWITYLAESGTEPLLSEHPEYYQKVKTEEEERAHLPRFNPDRENIQSGHWLCPDRGLALHEKALTETIVKELDIDGIAIDYLGYRNYYACFCDFSVDRRSEFAKSHPELSEREVLTLFSEQSLIGLTEQIWNTVKAIKPEIKIAIHVYPDFDLNPEYGNKLYVDYCGQTVSWLYRPFWSLGKVHDAVLRYKKSEAKTHAFNQFVPFVGTNQGELRKDPERLRREIRIAGSAGSTAIMIAFYHSLVEDPRLIEVMADELNDT